MIISQIALHRCELDALQDGVSLRIRNNLLFDAVSARSACIYEPERRNTFGQPMNLRVCIVFFLGEELSFPGDDQSHVADAGLIDAGIKDFVEDSMAQREPDMAFVADGRAHAGFGAGCPTRWNPGRAGCVLLPRDLRRRDFIECMNDGVSRFVLASSVSVLRGVRCDTPSNLLVSCSVAPLVTWASRPCWRSKKDGKILILRGVFRHLRSKHGRDARVTAEGRNGAFLSRITGVAAVQ